MSKRHRILMVVISGALALNMAIGLQVYSDIARETGEEDGYERVKQFISVLKLIQKNYVDDSQVGYENLVYGALRGMLSSLDDFSTFIPPDEYKNMIEETEGEFGGIGVIIKLKEKTVNGVKKDILTIVMPMSGSPGARAGLRANDEIVKIDGVDTIDLEFEESIKRIKGEPGTNVELTIYRPTTEETLPLTIKRAMIEIGTVKDAHLIDDGIAYVNISQFNDKTPGNLQDALAELTETDLQALIIDLRNNPGGLLNAAIDVSSMFIPKRKLIVFTEGNKRTQRQDFSSLPGTKHRGFPIAILINEGSASGAEIVAGCLQDYNRAILIGEKSYGKGSVQSIIELDDGSAIRLTTSKYYTPSERVIHGNGIAPDFVVDISDEDSHRMHIQLSRFDGMPRDPEDLPDIADEQLKEALAVLKDILAKVRGGGKDFSRIIAQIREIQRAQAPGDEQERTKTAKAGKATESLSLPDKKGKKPVPQSDPPD